MARADTFRVVELLVKVQQGAPMIPVSTLQLSTVAGVVGDINADWPSPRQISIAVLHSLDTHGVSMDGARSNLIVAPTNRAHLINSGSLLTIDQAMLRVTMTCEPCGHGARLARVTSRTLAKIERYLAVVVGDGEIKVHAHGNCHPGVYEPAPEDFKSRCAWALDRVPPGHVISSVDFLVAIGAGKTYSRILPQWLRAAAIAGKPAHRVLTADMRMSPWIPDAIRLLNEEGIDTSQVRRQSYPLSEILWFEESHEQARTASNSYNSWSPRLREKHT